MGYLLIVAGLVVLAYACRTFENRYIAKAGLLAMFGATYVGALALTGSHSAGALGVGLWFFLPWVEILGRVRKLRFPLDSEVRHRFPPNQELFPDLDELSSEVEAAGFVSTDDTGWKWDETDNFMRLFYHPDQRIQASIILASQQAFAISYVSLTSRTLDGRTLATSNYPFSYTMKFSPRHRINRHPGAESFDDLLAAHLQFLQANGVTAESLEPLDPDHLSDYVMKEMRQQIDHNLSVGVLEKAGEGLIRYTWRGCVFLWLQVVKDMLRV